MATDAQLIRLNARLKINMATRVSSYNGFTIAQQIGHGSYSVWRESTGACLATGITDLRKAHLEQAKLS
jgi:hypothetical protein